MKAPPHLVRRLWAPLRRPLSAFALTLAVAGAAGAAPEPLAPLKFDLSPDGRSFVRLISWHQVWARVAEFNPGSEVQGEPTDTQFDVGLRRARFLLWSELGRVQLVAHFGMNNQTFNGARKPQLYLHDAWGSVEVVPEALTVGAGLHFWHGISRLTSSSTLSLLTLDAPIVNWPTIERGDQFARHLGLFAKGRLGRLDYRLAVNQPFAVDWPLPASGAAGDRPGRNGLAYAGYAQWFFFEAESNTLPYVTGTYLGTKRVFNLGLGAQYAPDAMASLSASGVERRHDQLLLGADVFWDQPLGAGALTAYGVFYHYDLGPDHVRNIGIMNTGAGGSGFNGGGNAYPVIGTGQHVYLQAGYLLPTEVQLQPYVESQVSFMEALDDSMVMLGAGLNWYVHGQNAKLTLHYRARPEFEAGAAGARAVGHRSEAIVQLHVRI